MTNTSETDLIVRAVEAMQHAVMITDADGVILHVNAAFEEITGWAVADTLGRTPRILKSGLQDDGFYATLWKTLLGTGHWRGEIWNRQRSGEVYPEALSISAIRDAEGMITHFVACFADITSSKANEAQLTRLAYHDIVTGLPNRALFQDRLDQALAQANRNNERVGVAIVDLDGFKQVNDALGHKAGDQLLKMVGQRLVDCARASDSIARLGGDEFGVVLPRLVDPDGAANFAKRVVTSVSKPCIVDGETVTVGASVGIATFPADGTDSETLVQNADLAMYAAKRAGKSTFCRFADVVEAIDT